MDSYADNMFLRLLHHLQQLNHPVAWRTLLDAVILDYNRNSTESSRVRAARSALARNAIARDCPCTAFVVVTYTTAQLRTLRCIYQNNTSRINREVYVHYGLEYPAFTGNISNCRRRTCLPPSAWRQRAPSKKPLLTCRNTPCDTWRGSRMRPRPRW